MPGRLYKILLILGISFAILSVPAFWFSYPLFNDFLNQGRAANELEVDFLDVGQGDAILIKTPAGQNILIDGGPDNTVIKRLSENLPWWERTIDLVILTHPHDDHVNGLNDVLKRYNVEKILYTGVTHSSPGYLSWLELIRSKKIPLVIIDQPQEITLDEDCYLDIIYPRTSFLNREVDNLNNSSIVARLVYGQTVFLLTGDAEAEVEQELLDLASTTDLSAPMLKVGHHGSDTSSSEEFLDTVQPQIAIIPAALENKFGHPSLRVVKRLERLGAAVYQTGVDGTVRAVSDGVEIRVE